jgi:hypothetical protein
MWKISLFSPLLLSLSSTLANKALASFTFPPILLTTFLYVFSLQFWIQLNDDIRNLRQKDDSNTNHTTDDDYAK